MLPSPTRCAPGAEVFSPAGSHPLPPLRSVPARRGVAGPPPSPPQPGPAAAAARRSTWPTFPLRGVSGSNELWGIFIQVSPSDSRARPRRARAGWKENHATFMNELKNLQAEGLTTLGQSLRTAFDLLNLNRLVTGIDNYGQGRNPFFLEPAIIITITDGSKLTTTSGVQDEPPRTSHPVVKFSCTDCEPMVIDKLPFDKYELEPSPLTQFILERKSPQTCWQVYVSNSAKYSELGHPFGYLKASTALNCVNLFVMPYNYPVLLPLLDDLFKVHKAKPTLKWRQSFESYLKTMPPYYLGPLKKAVRMMGAPNLIADSMEYGLSYSVISYLKKLSQQAKIESDRVIGSVGKKVVQETGIKVRSRSHGLSMAYRKDFQQLLQGISEDVPHRLLDLNMKEYTGFQVALLNKDLKPQTFRNAYDIPRRNLLDHLTRMRSNLLKSTRRFLKGQDEDQVHSVPIAQMGNYQEYLKQVPSPLRELDPDQPRRLHTFGNPFKLDKKGMMIDEADEFVAGPQNKHKRPGEPNMQGIPKRRRCMSPLLRGRQQNPVVNNHIGGKGPPVPMTQAQPDLIKPLPLHKISEATNDSTMDDVVENHVADQLSSDITPNAMEAEFSGSSPANLLERPTNHTEALGHDHLGTNDLTVGGFLENHEEPRDKEQCPEENTPASSLNKGKKLMHCRSHEEVNTELKAQIMKEIRKPGRKYERIFTLLKHVQGSLQTRLIFLQNVIKEASRFKKRMLIEQLENFLDEIHRRANQINHINSN
ncbi:integrator complex subunit 6 isoform X3 [Cervus elaphus]|uniref:integrator complex subunit 6 isoform X3 n=1 Tax=Cervus elaphus TaxID=9860 RepID=UPI001CC2FE9A|nr:integrator complex subunit 6 isoform X3 [Cervus elaphus]